MEGHRCSRLGLQWRVIYRTVPDKQLFQVTSITAHARYYSSRYYICWRSPKVFLVLGGKLTMGIEGRMRLERHKPDNTMEFKHSIIRVAVRRSPRDE